MAGHDHPLFTWLYQRLARLEKSGPVGQARDEVSSQLHGRLLIVGMGPAQDLHHLPDAVTEVVGVEPSASMRKAAQPHIEAAAEKGLSVEVVDAVAEELPLPDGSVDSVLFAYVLCSVEDPARAVSEALRVLRPGGTIAVLEHVAGSPGSWMRRAQDVISPVWPRLAAGCRCNQDTRAVFEAAGVDVSGLRQTTMVPIPPVAPALVGIISVD